MYKGEERNGAERNRYRQLNVLSEMHNQGYLTDEEYQFWLNVRNTHAIINDKSTKEYTKDQILKWYNSLHTDSSEYKMWGNGIALPNALYVMQGIADVMESEQKAARKKWLDDLLGDCL